MRQSDIFIDSEGDRWLERNRAGLGVRDPVAKVMEAIGITPESVLEIGCANGWRLSSLRKKYGCKVYGVEPSGRGATEAAVDQIPVFTATAAALPIRGGAHDVVIYGFCLYLADPADWFKIVAEGDRVLKAGGYLIIHDFAAPYPYARRYKHCDGVMAYHVDFADFWLANPLYTIPYRRTFFDDEMVFVLRKRPIESIEVLP